MVFFAPLLRFSRGTHNRARTTHAALHRTFITAHADSWPLHSVNAFYVEYKLPIEVTSGDEVSIPFTVVNTTNDDLKVALFQKSTGTCSSCPPPQTDGYCHSNLLTLSGRHCRALDIHPGGQGQGS